MHLTHVAGHKRGLLMRHLIGAGTPKEAAVRGRVLLLVVHGEDVLVMILLAVVDLGSEGHCGFPAFAVTAMPT